MKKRKLIIVGAAGHGREVAYTFLLNHAAEDFLGFLYDLSKGTTPEGWPILGKVEDWPRWKDGEFVVGINDPRTRRSVVAKMESLGAPNGGGHSSKCRGAAIREVGSRLHDSWRGGDDYEHPNREVCQHKPVGGSRA